MVEFINRSILLAATLLIFQCINLNNRDKRSGTGVNGSEGDKVTCNPGKVHVNDVDENSEPDYNDNCNCGGKPNADWIVGGEDSKRGEFPWMWAMAAAGTRAPFCGSSVINNRSILTAIRQTNDFDVALIKLNKPIDFGKIETVMPAFMPHGNHYHN